MTCPWVTREKRTRKSASCQCLNHYAGNGGWKTPLPRFAPSHSLLATIADSGPPTGPWRNAILNEFSTLCGPSDGPVPVVAAATPAVPDSAPVLTRLPRGTSGAICFRRCAVAAGGKRSVCVSPVFAVAGLSPAGSGPGPGSVPMPWGFCPGVGRLGVLTLGSVALGPVALGSVALEWVASTTLLGVTAAGWRHLVPTPGPRPGSLPRGSFERTAFDTLCRTGCISSKFVSGMRITPGGRRSDPQALRPGAASAHENNQSRACHDASPAKPLGEGGTMNMTRRLMCVCVADSRPVTVGTRPSHGACRVFAAAAQGMN